MQKVVNKSSNFNKTIKISSETHSRLEVGKTGLGFKSFDEFLFVLASTENLFFIKNNGKTGSNDVETVVKNLHEEMKKHISKQVGRPIAKLSEYEKLYFNRVNFFELEFERVNMKLEAILKVVKGEVDLLNSEEYTEVKKDNLVSDNDYNRIKKMYENEEERSKNLEKENIELINKLKELKNKFQKKSAFIGSKSQYEAVISEEEFNKF